MKTIATRTLAAVLLGTAGLMLAVPVYAGAKTVKVGMTNSLKFTPAKVTIHKGDTVKWTNGSQITHTVTDVPRLASKQGDATLPKGAKKFNSGYLNPGESYSHTFTVAGTYHYFCIPHEATGMTGVVTVKP